MKKAGILCTAVVTAIVIVALSLGSTLAYFKDIDTEVGLDFSAGRFEVSVELELANYGVPGDELLTAFGDNDTPAASKVTVTNKCSMDMDYTLYLTVDNETVEIFEPSGFQLKNAAGQTIQFTGEPTSDESGNLTYVYKSTAALKSGAFDELGLALTFKGRQLIDGNDYQNRPITITPVVIANQAGGAKL